MSATYIDLSALDAFSRARRTAHPYYGLTTNQHTAVPLPAYTGDASRPDNHA
jgi:hypothetical protein